MITDRQQAKSPSELRHALGSALADSKTVVVQAGHFLLYQPSDSNSAIPCLADLTGDYLSSDVRNELGHFPELSWRLAIDCLTGSYNGDLYMLVLVNDWQYVRDPEARARFYRQGLTLPVEYVSHAASAARPGNFRLLTPTGISDFQAKAPYFSEQALRSRFKRRIRKLIDAAQLPPESEASENEAGLSCSLTDAIGQKREIYCSGKAADCAAEVAQLIDEATSLVSCDTLVNFYPRVCAQFVEFGSELAPRIFQTPIRRVINVALTANQIRNTTDLLNGAELIIHEF